MATQEHFRVSSLLKDVIGQDLVTNEFVAMFELVKNSFDAGASRVDIAIANDRGEIWIVDDGKGMDADAIRDRWLFVAYSAKKDGTERSTAQADYRDRIRPNGQFAGSKGIGRFSCDTLGGLLTMYTRTSQRQPTEVLSIIWSKFEEDGKRLFQKVGVSLSEDAGFPDDAPVTLPRGAGTALKIGNPRTTWDFDKIWRLRQYLAKLIDPFGTTDDTPVHLTVIDRAMDDNSVEQLSGPIANDIRDLLQDKTTRILVNLEGETIRTELIDRGRTIYRITEPNEFLNIREAAISMEVYYLNRSAKHTFTSRMGVRPVEFGSIFLFLNGFRVFPIGEETDDTLGLGRRKQQGQARYLGTRDLLGRVDVVARAGLFREASNREGFIRGVTTTELYEAILRKAVVRLERYVVGVTWQDAPDQHRDDASGLDQLSTRARVATIIGQLAARSGVEIEYYDPEIVELFENDASSLEQALGAISTIAQHSGDSQLLARVEAARARQAQLEESERQARAAAAEAMAAAARADARIALLERQTRYLASTQDVTVEQMSFLLHQVLIYANHIGAAVDRSLGFLREALDAAADFDDESATKEDLRQAAAAVRYSARKARDDVEEVHLENDRLIAVARFASNARFELETDKLEGDVVAFLDEYVNQVRVARDGTGSIEFHANGLSQEATFPPVDIVLVVDNLMDNARKHGARQLFLEARKGKAGIEVVVSDDGRGMDENQVDARRIFDKGYTSTKDGTGLGLYHVRQVLTSMGGSITLNPAREPGRVEFVISLPRGKS